MTIVMGDSSGRPVKSASQLDAEIIGFIYDPQDGQTAPEALLADEVAHFIPPGLRDPLARFRGMSWLTPIIREVQADQAATMHKLGFFENGATPQMVVTFDATVTEDQFKAFVSKMDDGHKGWRNAYKTLYLGGGATPTVVGKDLQQFDFSATQGKGETRIAAASGIHPVLVPVSEGMQGSSLERRELRGCAAVDGGHDVPADVAQPLRHPRRDRSPAGRCRALVRRGQHPVPPRGLR